MNYTQFSCSDFFFLRVLFQVQVNIEFKEKKKRQKTHSSLENNKQPKAKKKSPLIAAFSG